MKNLWLDKSLVIFSRISSQWRYLEVWSQGRFRMLVQKKGFFCNLQVGSAHYSSPREHLLNDGKVQRYSWRDKWVILRCNLHSPRVYDIFDSMTMQGNSFGASRGSFFKYQIIQIRQLACLPLTDAWWFLRSPNLLLYVFHYNFSILWLKTINLHFVRCTRNLVA